MLTLLTNMPRDVLIRQLQDGLVLLVLGMGFVFIFLAAATGGIKVPFWRILRGIFVEYDEEVAIIVQLRFPRIFVAILKRFFPTNPTRFLAIPNITRKLLEAKAKKPRRCTIFYQNIFPVRIRRIRRFSGSRLSQLTGI